MTRTRIILAIVAGVVVVWMGWRGADRLYIAPRADLRRSIANTAGVLSRYADARRDRPRLERELQTVINQTLGGDLETVDHKMRSRLNRLAEHVGLQNFTVGTAASVRRQSPARQSFGRGPLREETDFVEVPGWISGQGTFDQMLRLVAGVEAEPWIKRIDRLEIDPTDNGGKFDVSVHMTTLFLPGKSRSDELTATIPAPELNKYAAFVQTNPFRLPPAPPPTPTPKPPVNATPAGFPYELWTMTGVAQGSAGAEVWLRNSQTHEERRLAVGERLQDVILQAGGLDSAEFVLGQQRFVVKVGQNLNDRTPVNQ